MTISGKQIKKLSFNDYPLFKMVLDESNLKCTIVIDGATQDLGDRIEILKKGTLLIQSWQSLIVQRVDSYETNNTPIWTLLEGEDIEMLYEIYVAEFEGNYILKGLGIITHKWVEYIFTNPKVEYVELK